MVSIRNGWFTWNAPIMESIKPKMSPQNGFAIRNMTLKLCRRELVGVCGPVGSGKASLINAILVELHCSSVAVGVRSSKIYFRTRFRKC